jgi:hypothetical protein
MGSYINHKPCLIVTRKSQHLWKSVVSNHSQNKPYCNHAKPTRMDTLDVTLLTDQAVFQLWTPGNLGKLCDPDIGNHGNQNVT